LVATPVIAFGPAAAAVDFSVRSATPRSVEGHRWAIEDSFEAAKNELGLDHNETRSWHGWHRHISLVMLAFAMMAVIRHRADAVSLKEMLPSLSTKPRSSSAGRSRKSDASP
jgi:SRSO17 transposase